MTASGHVADPDTTYDVAILGNHLASGLLAAILARHGVRVVLMGAPADQVEPSGDSTVPYTTAVFQLLAERFEVPEIAAFAHFVDLPERVRRSSGIKKSLAFLHHTSGRKHDPRHTVQFHVPGEHNEWHLYRPIVDDHARAVAVGHGAHTVSDPVASVRLGDDSVVVTDAGGRSFVARYVVDACGMDSPLLGSLGVVEPTSPLILRSRMLTTHMRGVKRFEDVVRLGDYRRATAFSKGTVHHLFDGGWIQVVDFGNHDGSTNQVCAVTVGLDPDRFPDLPAEPEAAFRALVARFPSIATQFAGASSCRPWVTGDPWQRTTKVTYGARWFAMERSACRTDEFLSRDVTVAAEVVHALAAALLRIVRQGGSAEPELARVAAFQGRLIDFNDRMLAAARTAASDFRLWNAYSRVWLLWQILAHLSLKRASADAVAAGSWQPVERFDHALWFETPAGVRGLLDWFFDQFEQVRSGTLAPAAAAAAIFKALRRARFVPPLYKFGDPGARYYHFTMPRRLLMLAWVMTVAPSDFKRLLSRENVTGRRQEPTPEQPATAGSGRT
ncbi:MAG TPA: hypothetical protein VFM55_16180 [Micromonosporaceae bacterium]|nr:hypothetical protein [Micromonosporaceae bacterium]